MSVRITYHDCRTCGAVADLFGQDIVTYIDRGTGVSRVINRDDRWIRGWSSCPHCSDRLPITSEDV